MNKAWLKAAFGASVLILWMGFSVLMFVAIEALFPVRRRADGLYQSSDRMPLGILTMAFSVWLANLVTSLFFRATRLSDERWSIFSRRWR